MSANIRPNGLGETLGDALATTKPLYLTGSVWFVRSGVGTDAVAPAGQDRERPLATLAQAVTNASAGDTVVLMDGHTETLTSEVTVSKQLFIVGGGSSGGIPTVSFTCNAANKDTLLLTVANTEIRNVRFKEAAQANAGGVYGAKLAIVNVTGCRVIGCYFDQGAKDTGAYAIYVGGASHNTRIANTTVISTATSSATRPIGGIFASIVSDLELDGVVLSDGTVGFQNAAFYTVSAITRLRAQNLSLLLGADFVLATWTGWIATPTTSGSARVAF